MSSPTFTKTSDPLHRLTEFNKSQVETQRRPQRSDAKQDILLSPVIQEFGGTRSPSNALQKVDGIIDLIDDQLFKDTAMEGTVLVEWHPVCDKAVHDKEKDEKVFVKWQKGQDPGETAEDLRSLEQDYLNVSKLNLKPTPDTNTE